MTFELLCATIIALLFGTMICFGGYRLFLALLPIWGFFFGFGLGAQSVQLLFGQGFLSTVTGWVVGFVVAILFAVLSYLFYAFAVAIMAGSLGYGLGIAMIGVFSANLTLISWFVGMVMAVVFIIITFRFALAKYMIIVATAVGGAAATVATLVVGVDNVQVLRLAENPAKVMATGSFIWTLLFLLMAGAGIAMQVAVNRAYEIETYNRWAEIQAQA
ncbi:MAG: DUF4203 domain-containing protein [Chloroflexi bacterium]|nr:DUF4203 domain-containing protein [Chloroflexota bacterium]MBP6803635.1 DUF4203 domain-containing protein [Chloroflexota bacterium]MBP7592698.1 DUF4203 domain-containing protein [Chloroflexota bacterium]